jgi:hypothetical protein
MKRILPALLAGALFVLPAAGQAAPDPSAMGDEEFLTFLEDTPFREDDPRPQLDQRRLAKLLFSVGATLGGGKTNVRMLQGAMQLREGQSGSTREMTAARFAAYEEAVERFRADVSLLLDVPESLRRLHRALNDGHEVCWRLDAYTRLMETYGVSAQDLVSILASREACDAFRRAAFSYPVQGTLSRALQSAEEWRRQVRALEEEIGELEKLVQDLREIEGR